MLQELICTIQAAPACLVQDTCIKNVNVQEERHCLKLVGSKEIDEEQ